MELITYHELNNQDLVKVIGGRVYTKVNGANVAKGVEIFSIAFGVGYKIGKSLRR